MSWRKRQGKARGHRVTLKTILFLLAYLVLFGAVAYGKWRVRLLLPYRAMNFIAGGFALYCLAIVWAVLLIVLGSSLLIGREEDWAFSRTVARFIFHGLTMVSLALSAYGWWRMAHDQMRFFEHLRRRNQATTGERAAFAPPPEITQKDCITGATLIWRLVSVSLICLLALGYASTYNLAKVTRREAAAMGAEVKELRDEVIHLTDKINDVSEFLKQQKVKQVSEESRRQFDDAIEMLKRPRVQLQNYADRTLDRAPEVR
jgi:hypothetical protein